MKPNFAVLFLLALAVVLAGCTAQPSGEATASAAAQQEKVYTVSLPSQWQEARTAYAGVDASVGGFDLAGRPYSISVASRAQNGATVSENGDNAIAEVTGTLNAVEEPLDGFNNQAVNRIGAGDWYVLCYSYYEDEATVRDSCNAVTLCNGKQVVVTLSAAHAGMPTYAAEYKASLESFKCKNS